MTQGHLLGGYTYTKHKSAPAKETAAGEVVVLSTIARQSTAITAFEEAQVLAEAVIMAGIGTLVGVALGVWFGAGLFTVLSGNFAAATIHLPWLQLIVLGAGGALAGVAAGWWPARRAARRPILEAVGYE